MTTLRQVVLMIVQIQQRAIAPFYKATSVTGCGSFLANGLYESEEVNVINSRLRILKRNQTRETKEAATNDRETELVPNAEMVAHVKCQ